MKDYYSYKELINSLRTDIGLTATLNNDDYRPAYGLLEKFLCNIVGKLRC